MCSSPKRSRRSAKQTRILLVDDHPLLRKGTTPYLEAEPDLAVCGEAGNDVEAMRALEDLRPDMVITDISIPGRDGIELTKDLKAQRPDLLVIVLSMHDESLYAERAFRAGAAGYVMKSEAPDHLVGAIREVLNGGLYASPEYKDRTMRRLFLASSQQAQSPLELLSDRELEVFQHLGHGHATRDIASRLNVSASTVESYRANIKRKLRLKNASELVCGAAEFVLRENSPPSPALPSSEPELA
ncbi:MAG: response regulator transcription factor [Lentisphaerae bacterium]|nr:response regulator transcription factor [Lentisphaerota bacterium]